ncbi:hypothetical protein CYMTET_19738 [Cymbomonas tetramitiformis]|uniref:Nephrocystin 3-like N-terminal domain-containing protein n=1 Tax=Cymbomonas tetramitiformis TaxID=36881 RepID=A0AAE0L4Y0_9CHLO|nr:hypothetical protein CYMTET_19738 [Cymbomonas tetramitiformis]
MTWRCFACHEETSDFSAQPRLRNSTFEPWVAVRALMLSINIQRSIPPIGPSKLLRNRWRRASAGWEPPLLPRPRRRCGRSALAHSPARCSYCKQTSALGAPPPGRLLYRISQDWPAELSLLRHQDTVISLDFSKDGKLILTGCNDNVLRLWDVPTGILQTELEGHEDVVSCCKFSPDGSMAASGSWDCTIKLWDLLSGVRFQEISCSSGWILSLAFSADGTKLFTGSDDSVAQMWDLATGKVQVIYDGHQDRITSVAITSDTRILATGSWDCTVRLWDVASGRERAQLKGHTAWVSNVAFSPDDSLLVSGGHDNLIRVWDVLHARQLQEMQGHGDNVLGVSWSPDGKTVASGSHDATVRLWDIGSGQQLAELQGHSDMITSVVFHPEGHSVASGSDDGTVRMWDVFAMQQRTKLQSHGVEVTAVAFTADGTRVASGSLESTMRVWDVQSGALHHEVQGAGDFVTAVAFSTDGRMVASGSWDNTVRLWDLATGKNLSNLIGHEGWVIAVAFSPNGDTLASGSHDMKIRLWDVSTGKSKGVFSGHDDRVTALAFSSDGKWLASGCHDHMVRLWEVASGQLVTEMPGHTGGVTSVAINALSSMVASGSFDQTVRLWSVPTGKLYMELKGHQDRVTAVAYSAEGDCVVSGSVDRTLRIWDGLSGQLQAELVAHTGEVTSVAFSMDGAMVVSGSNDRTIRVWDTAAVCQHAAKLRAQEERLLTASIGEASGSHREALPAAVALHLWDESGAPGAPVSEGSGGSGEEGVSVAFLLMLQERLRRTFPGQELSTREVAELVVKEMTKNPGGGLDGGKGAERFIDLPQMRSHRGPPALFVCHALCAAFASLVAQVQTALQGGDARQSFVWVDIFALRQHHGIGVGGEMTPEALDVRRQRIREVRSGTLVVADEGPEGIVTVLGQAMCIFEIWSTLQLRGAGWLHMPDMTTCPGAVWQRIVPKLDLKQCKTPVASDMKTLLGAVERNGGMANQGDTPEAGDSVEALNHLMRAFLNLQPLSSRKHYEPAHDAVSLQEFDAWAARPPSPGRTLWVTGAPGTGKSTLCEAIVRRHRQALRSNMEGDGKEARGPAAYALLHFFVDKCDARRRDPMLLLRTLAFQLMCAFPEQLGPYYSSLGAAGLHGFRSVLDAFRTLLLEPITEGLPEGARVMILVDGIDEGQAPSVESAPSVRRSWQQPILQLVCMHLCHLPEFVSLMVTSQPPPEEDADDMLDDLEHMIHAHVESESLTEHDITEYVQPEHIWREMRAHLIQRIGENAAVAVMTKLQHSSGGDMAYCHVVKEWLQVTGELVSVDNVPASLGTAYRAYLDALGEAVDRAAIRELVLVAAREPLSFKLLAQLGLAGKGGAGTTEVLRSMGFLFRCSRDFKVEPFHKSVLEFFMSRELAGDFFADQVLGHQRLFSTLFRDFHASAPAPPPSKVALRHALLHGHYSGEKQMKELVASLEFWHKCYNSGFGEAVYHDLLWIDECEEEAAAGSAVREQR